MVEHSITTPKQPKQHKPEHKEMTMEQAIKYAKKLGITLLDKQGKNKTLKQLTKEIHAHSKKQY